MTKNTATLHLLSGKIAAGKSTLAADLGRAPNTVVVSEDEWLSALFGDEMRTLADYVRCSSRLRTALEPHLIDLLSSGVSVVLDFAANTPETRVWMRELFTKAGCEHRLHYLDLSDEICRERLHRRNAEGLHPFAATDAEFDRVTSYFVPPSADEGFDILIHNAKEAS